jgi:hypothetical protein
MAKHKTLIPDECIQCSNSIAKAPAREKQKLSELEHLGGGRLIETFKLHPRRLPNDQLLNRLGLRFPTPAE